MVDHAAIMLQTKCDGRSCWDYVVDIMELQIIERLYCRHNGMVDQTAIMLQTQWNGRSWNDYVVDKMEW